MHSPQRRLPHDERRRLIIETTLACLARDGADGTTLRSVCRELGVAPSLITHFFDGWHDVLVAAYGFLTESFMAQLSPVMKLAFPDAAARMDAVIVRYLSTDWIGEHTVGANIAMWQLSRSVQELRPSFTRFMRERNRLMRRALGELAAERKVDLDLTDLTTCFMLMLDGVWLEHSVNPGNLKERRILRMCRFWLDRMVPPEGTRRNRARRL
jgi:AcrR family transcriptional regulator